jgi:hypothetical protein
MFVVDMAVRLSVSSSAQLILVLILHLWHFPKLSEAFRLLSRSFSPSGGSLG